jgi:uncharacterized protein YrrD
MLHSFKEIRGYDIRAEDGAIGDVHDLYFDDRYWTVRYLVIDTGSWLFGRKVLIAPEAAGRPDVVSQSLSLSLTRERIKNSPDIDTNLPVSRQNEIELREHYAWPSYWDHYPPLSYAALSGAPPFLSRIPAPGADREPPVPEEQRGDPNLRSAREVDGYHIAAEDGEIGHVEDFLIDEDGWIVRYLVVDTRNWLPGKKVLVAPARATKIRWDERMLYVGMDRQSVLKSPAYAPDRPIDRNDESGLRRRDDVSDYRR